MKTTYKTILIALALCWVGTSCTPEDDLRPNAEEAIVPAHITDSVYHEEAKMMAYNFVYPSQDPFGQPVMLSGTITISDSVKRHPATGCMRNSQQPPAYIINSAFTEPRLNTDYDY